MTRTMRPPLEAWFSSLSPTERRVLARLPTEVDSSELMGGLLSAIRAGVMARVWQRILALTAVIWHNDHSGQPVLRSLTAYDH
jgi:hypothetical protein